MNRRLSLAGALAVSAIALSPAALAAAPPAPIYQEAAASALRAPVYVAPDAGADITAGEVAKLDQQVKRYGVPVYVAILPKSAIDVTPGGVDGTPAVFGAAVGRTGVYAVVAGHSFRANSNGALPSGETADIANKAFQSNYPPNHGGRIYPLLSDFVKHVDYAIHPGDKPKSNTGEVALIVVGAVAFAIALCLLTWWAIRRSQRVAEEREKRDAFEQQKRDRQARLTRVQDDTLALSDATNAEAKRHRAEAVGCVSRATDLLDRAESVEDLRLVDNELADAESNVATAKAYEAGRDPAKEQRDAEAKAAAAERQRQKERAAVERKQREQAQAEERERKELAKKVKPANFKPIQASSTTHNHYYGGGYYNGSYFGPGYYTDPFWTWVAMDAIADSAYDAGAASASSSGSDWSGSSSSYDSGSSSGSDYSSGGGGYDSGSSGFDSSSGGGGDGGSW